MAPTTLAEPGPTVGGPTQTPRARGIHPIVPSMASALLLWLAFPPAGLWLSAWFAPAFLFSVVNSPRSRRAVYFGAWAGGFAFWLLAIQWVRLTDASAWLAWVVMALFLSLWWPAFIALARIGVRGLRLPLMLAAPILWVGLEHLRAFILTGFPWYYLGHSQYAIAPLIQIADVTGALGLSWLVALVNAWWVDLVSRPLLRRTPRGIRPTPAQSFRASVVAAALLATLAYGLYRLGTAEFRKGPVLALLQSNIEQSLKMEADKELVIERIFRGLADDAVRTEPRPDLVVWPETSYPFYGFGRIHPKLDPAELERQGRELLPDADGAFWRQRVELLSEHLHGWTDVLGVPMLVGAILHDFDPAGHARYNSAVLFQPGIPSVQAYHKIHLVPFGEYVPLIDYLPWLTALTPYQGRHVPSLSFGHDPSALDLGPYRIATAICFEDTVPHVVRRFFHEAADGHQPDVLVNISNDGWFHGSSEHDMHLAVSVFRAVENRVPLARAVNTGISAVIDGNGRILGSLPKLRQGVLKRAIPLDDRTSFYTAWGDWLGLGCFAVAIGLAPTAFLRRKLQPPPA